MIVSFDVAGFQEISAIRWLDFSEQRINQDPRQSESCH